MPVVAMFGSLFVTTGQSTGLCCGKSRRVGTKTETTATQFMANRSTSNHNSLSPTPQAGNQKQKPQKKPESKQNQE